MAIPTQGLSLPDDVGADNFAAFRAAFRRLVGALRGLVAREKTVLVTLTANAASTTFTDPRIQVTTAYLPQATTANASAEIGNGTMYVSETNRIEGAWTIVHANNAQTDRIFRVKLGGA